MTVSLATRLVLLHHVVYSIFYQAGSMICHSVINQIIKRIFQQSIKMSPHFRRNSNKDFNCFSQRSVDKERPIIEDDHHKCKMKRKVFFIWKTKKLDFFEKLTNEKKFPLSSIWSLARWI